MLPLAFSNLWLVRSFQLLRPKIYLWSNEHAHYTEQRIVVKEIRSSNSAIIIKTVILFGLVAFFIKKVQSFKFFTGLLIAHQKSPCYNLSRRLQGVYLGLISLRGFFHNCGKHHVKRCSFVDNPVVFREFKSYFLLITRLEVGIVFNREDLFPHCCGFVVDCRPHHLLPVTCWPTALERGWDV